MALQATAAASRRTAGCSSGVARLRAVSIAVLMLAAGAGFGPAVEAQSLQQALTQAYRTNPQLDAARATQRATDESVARANASYRPVVSGNATSSWTRTDTRPEQTPGELHPRQFGVTVAQPLFRGFRSLNQVRVAEANVRAGRETLRAVEQTVLLAAATAYVDVVRDQAVVRLRENNVNVLTNQLKATQDQFSVGEVTRTDVAQAEARRSRGISELEVARGNLRNSRAIYERVVGSAPGRLNEASEPSRLMPKSLPEATAIAQRENPLVVNALYAEQAARYDIELIRGELLPTVTLNASYTRGYDTSRTVDLSDDRRISTTMSVPIYSGGEIEARVRAAKHIHVNRLQTIEQVRTEQLALVVGAWARYQAAKAQGQSSAAQVRASQTALTGVREEYRVGQRTLLDVLNAEQELLDAQVLEVTARRDAVVQAYTLLQAVGRLSAAEMALGSEIYDAEIHYFEVRRKWFGLSITHADGRRERVDASWEPVTHKPVK
jgi:outer membrane protein